MERLAVEGGTPVRSAPWPAWPRVTDASEAVLLAALHSGRWAISGLYTGEEPYERRFAEAYARFHDVPYCVPTCNGSSALVIALGALGVGQARGARPWTDVVGLCRRRFACRGDAGPR